MPSSYSNSSPSNSPIILDSEASTIVISDSDSDDDSVTSSIFGFTCQICELRAKNATELEYKYISRMTYPSLILMVYTGANVMPVGSVGI